MNDEGYVMASYPGRDKWIWLCTEMSQDVGIGISNGHVWFTIICMLLVDITTVTFETIQQLYINL